MSEQPNHLELAIAEAALRRNEMLLRAALAKPGVSDVEASMIEQLIANQVPLTNVANWLRSLIENVPVRVTITPTDVRRARVLYCLHSLAACSPITLCTLADELEKHLGDEVVPDLQDAAGSLVALIGDLVEMGKNNSANETLGPVPAPFDAPPKAREARG